MDTLALLVSLLVGIVLGALLGLLWSRARPSAHDAVAGQALVRSGLARLEERLGELQRHRVSWQSQLHEQVEQVRRSTESLRAETSALSTALRRPQVRGRWGELHLRRAVELAGLVSRCDFSEQVTTHGEDSALRPDLVVHLAGGKQVVVDAKVPLDAFLDEDLAGHARQLRQHVDTLAGKAYWKSLAGSPEFVVLFVPGESFLSAALEAQPTLLEYAAERRVVLATPTTLIALLRTVAYAWSQELVAEKAQEIHALGRDLHGRLGTMAGHLDRLGRSLTGAVSAYNKTVASLETRVLVTARRFTELEVTTGELLEAVAEPREELPELRRVVEPVQEVRPTLEA